MKKYMKKYPAVILAPTLSMAKKVVKENFVAATVKAEYGKKVIKGKVITLAHRGGSYKDRTSPCLVEVDGLILPRDIILIPNINPGTIGGVLSLLGEKPKSKDFWEAVAFVDVNGPHNAYKLSYIQQDMLNAYNAWIPSETYKYTDFSKLVDFFYEVATFLDVNPHKAYKVSRMQHDMLTWVSDKAHPRYNKITDVTEVILSCIEPIQKIISLDEKMIEMGRIWAQTLLEETEDCLVKETKCYRAFNAPGVSCAGSYFSSRFQRVVPCTISLNLSASAITIAFEDGGKTLSAKKIVKRLWGPGTGGHPGIAGTPKGWKKTSDELEVEFFRAIDYIESLYESI